MLDRQHKTPPGLDKEHELAKAVQRGHESDAVPAKTIITVAFSLLLLAGTALLFVAVIMQRHDVSEHEVTRASDQWRLQNRNPGVQPNQAFTREQLEARLRLQLSSYEWKDGRHQIARIPIERAMQLLAERQMKFTFASADEAISADQNSQYNTGTNP